MRRPLLLLFLAFASACQDWQDVVGPRVELSAWTPSTEAAGDTIPGQYIVVFKPTVSNPRAVAQRLARENAGTLRYTYEHALKGFSAALPPQAVAGLRNNPNVAYLEPDRVVTADDSQINPPWGLDRIDQRSLPLNQTYNFDHDGAGVNLYMFDTGIRFDHVDFGGRALLGTDVFTGDANTAGADCSGHGTHTAGTAGGATYGVAKAATLYAVRVLDCQGSGTASGIIAGVDWVTANHVKPAFANMSLSGSANDAVDQAVRNSIAAGVAYSVSAGTSGTNPGDACTRSPARVAESMTIGATNSSDAKAAFSFDGPCVDWFAPGASILSASHQSPTATATRSGTSMAAPHVAGVAALFLAANPEATPEEVRARLVAELTKDIVTGSSSANNHLLYSRGDWSAPPGANQPPVANAGGPYSGVVGTAVQFDGSGSTDADGDLPLSYAWDFGDGSIGSGPTPSHSYAAAGEYTVTLVVTDSRNASSQAATTTATISSGGGDDDARVQVSIVRVVSEREYRVGAGGLQSGGPVYIDRADTYASVPALVRNQTHILTADEDWNHGGHGNFFRFQIDREAVVYVAFLEGANLPPWLRNNFVPTGQFVTVARGQALLTFQLHARTYPAGEVSLGSNRPGNATAMYTVMVAPVSSPGANQPPVADAGGPYSGAVGTAVQFDGSGSTDADGDLPLSYAWDFGDGSIGSGPTPSHSYAAAGEYTVTLVVTDSRNASSQPATTTATISSGGGDDDARVQVSIVRVVSEREYRVGAGGLQSGDPVYIDRADTYASVPALVRDQTYILTADEDWNHGGHGNFFRFQIDREAVVYVAFLEGANLPTWLHTNFVPTGQFVTVARGQALLTFQLHARTYPAGEVSLGSNRPGNATAMYTVMVKAVPGGN